MNNSENENKLIRNIKLTDDEQQELYMKLWELLKHQVMKYNGIDSTSLPVEKVQELLTSLLYTIAVVIEEDCISTEVLLQKNLEEVIHRGQEILDGKRKSMRLAWNRLCISIPQIHNVYYIGTVKNIGVFLDKYEIYYEAHKIPCSIDYPLMLPVPDEIQGISYIEEYINRLEIESLFVNEFDLKNAKQLLYKSVPNYKDFFFNWCEPVLINSIGREILGLDIKSLELDEKQVSRIYELLKDTSKEVCKVMVENTVCKVLERMHVSNQISTTYFCAASKEVAIRLYYCLESENLSHFFII